MMKRPFEIRVVLVRTIYERNIGATSRAMSNMGCEKLILIDPQCEITYEAQQAAASGQKGLQERVTYKNWEEFFKNEPESIRIAFTARDGRGRQVFEMSEVYKYIQNQSPQFQKQDSTPFPVHLIFGPEDWGLSNEDMEYSNFAACIPTFGENWSLNLAQAVLLALFDLRKNWGGERTQLDGQQKPRKTSTQQIQTLENTLRIWLEEMGFDLSKKKINVYTILRRMLLANTPTSKEVRILETVLQQSTRKLREWKAFRSQKS